MPWLTGSGYLVAFSVVHVSLEPPPSIAQPPTRFTPSRAPRRATRLLAGHRSALLNAVMASLTRPRLIRRPGHLGNWLPLSRHDVEGKGCAGPCEISPDHLANTVATSAATTPRGPRPPLDRPRRVLIIGFPTAWKVATERPSRGSLLVRTGGFASPSDPRHRDALGISYRTSRSMLRKALTSLPARLPGVHATKGSPPRDRGLPFVV